RATRGTARTTTASIDRLAARRMSDCAARAVARAPLRRRAASPELEAAVAGFRWGLCSPSAGGQRQVMTPDVALYVQGVAVSMHWPVAAAGVSRISVAVKGRLPIG